MRERKKDPAQVRREAVKKHDKEKVDKVTVRLPKGTKERILETGQAVNSFVIRAVLDALDGMEK